MSWDTSNRRSQLPADWRQRRARIIARDHGRCTNCGSTVRLEVHHTGDSQDHRDQSLSTLCHSCHAAETKTEATAQRWAPNTRAKRPSEPHPGLK